VLQQHKFLSVLFFVAVEEYDVPAEEEKSDSSTKYQLAKSTFTEFAKTREDKNCPVILFLNKKDLLEKRIADKDSWKAFKTTFEQYDGDKDINSVLKFLEKDLTSDVDTEEDKITVHCTCALDKDAMKVVWDSVREGILRASLAKVGI